MQHTNQVDGNPKDTVSIKGLSEYMNGYSFNVEVQFSPDLDKPNKVNGEYMLIGDCIYQMTNDCTKKVEFGKLSSIPETKSQIRRELKKFFVEYTA